MPKYKYFLLPYDESEIGAIEGWLELMADQGFKLTKIFIGKLVRFEKSSISKIRYCIYPRTGDECCDTPGWEHVGTLSRNFDVFVAEDSNDAVEPDIDPVIMEAALKKQIHRHKYGVILSILLAISWIILGKGLIAGGGLVTFLIDYDIFLPIGILVGIICVVIFGTMHFFAYIKRNKRIALIMERNKNPAVKSHKLLEITMVMIIVISLFVINSQLAKGNRIDTIPLDEYTLYLNLPLMEQISPEELSAAKAMQEKYGPDWIIDCFVTEESCYVAPLLLYIRQYGYTYPGHMTDGNEIRFGYNVNYYEMRSEDLAIRYEEELCIELSTGEMTVINLNGFDSASYFLKGETEDIVLRNGNIIITAMYYGSGRLLDSVYQFSY
ncbi:DUF2812 domain-containing protein [Sedimentibacter sp.]|uniref:DUF2812 domain-containing protein n=1 Tax=Sedimentibacter sp. TaxID=1960295 RepID=UPI00289E6A3A|nr:DUF2812 domain-containing protein [Sedimentibacter sp.]